MNVDAPDPCPPVTEKKSRTQKSVQMFNFAAKLNSEFAQKITDSPKVTSSAAVLGFSKLDPATQLDLIRDARELHLRDTAPVPAACDE